MVFKKKSDLGLSFISVWCVCPRIKPSNHSAKVTFMQQACFESLAFVGLILRKVGISSMTFPSCVGIVVSKHCVNLVFQAAYGSSQRCWRNYLEPLGSLDAVAAQFILESLCMYVHELSEKPLFSSISSLHSPSKTFLIALLELGAWGPWGWLLWELTQSGHDQLENLIPFWQVGGSFILAMRLLDSIESCFVRYLLPDILLRSLSQETLRFDEKHTPPSRWFHNTWNYWTSLLELGPFVLHFYHCPPHFPLVNCSDFVSPFNPLFPPLSLYLNVRGTTSDVLKGCHMINFDALLWSHKRFPCSALAALCKEKNKLWNTSIFNYKA